MNQIIQITPQTIEGVETNTVNARELHGALGVKKDFSNWIKPKLKDTMLDEGVDYLTHTQKGVGGKFDSIEYILTLDTAKHIAMMSRTSKGKEVRAYFIEVEKKSREGSHTKTIDLAVAHSLEAIAKGMTSLASSMQRIEKRVSALENASYTTMASSPPTPKQIVVNRTSYMLQQFKNLIEINPGINQSQLLTLAGQRRDDKKSRGLLQDMQGVLWQTTMYSNQILYYPLEEN